VDLAMTESLMTLLAAPIFEMERTGQAPQRMGNRHPRHAPHNVYRCAGDDQWVALAVRTDDEWRGLCRVLGNAEWTQDARYASAVGRKAHEDALDAAIESWTLRRTKEEAAITLLQAGVPAAPCVNPQELVEDPHLNARGFIAPVDHPEVGPRRAGSLPWRVDGAIPGLRRPAPLVGQHTASILHDLLGLSEAEIAELERAGALN
jgi:crotonobetainyl-CoA:carnitine CoA-transferase CaiB-like acyl-CoA transferase